MNKRVLTLLLFSYSICSTAFAQGKIIYGKITNETDIEGIHILNASSRYNTTTDENGNFSIQVKISDTLVFSSVSFIPQKVSITKSDFEKGMLSITLTEMINELSEVVLGPNLSGNLNTDLQNIKTEKLIDFEEAGLPGFKGKPQEKIVPLAATLFPTSIQLEPLYKYITGYYKKLKIRRKWDDQNLIVAELFEIYPSSFITEAYNIPKDRHYDFLLFCLESSSLQTDFKTKNYTSVLAIFEEKANEYVSRLELEKE